MGRGAWDQRQSLPAPVLWGVTRDYTEKKAEKDCWNLGFRSGKALDFATVSPVSPVPDYVRCQDTPNNLSQVLP